MFAVSQDVYHISYYYNELINSVVMGWLASVHGNKEIYEHLDEGLFKSYE